MENMISLRDVDTGAEQKVDLYNNTVTLRNESGHLVKMDLGQSDVHIDSALANYASGYKLAEGCADVAMPVVPVAAASDKYWEWDKDDAMQEVQASQASPGGAVKEVSPRLSSSSFSTIQYALGAFIPTEIEANADAPLRPAMMHIRRIMNALMLGRERRVATTMQTAGSYASGFKATIAAGAKWNGGASSNPVQDLYTRIEAAVMPITDIIMSELVWHDFVQNANVQKYTTYKDATPGIPRATSDQATTYAALLGLPPIHVCAMKYKSAASTYSYVWGNDVVLLHRPAGAGLPLDGQDISSGYTFRWSGGNVGDAAVDGGFIVRSFFNPYRGPRGGRQIIVTHNDAEKFITDSVSGLIISAHQ